MLCYIDSFIPHGRIDPHHKSLIPLGCLRNVFVPTFSRNILVGKSEHHRSSPKNENRRTLVDYHEKENSNILWIYIFWNNKYNPLQLIMGGKFEGKVVEKGCVG